MSSDEGVREEEPDLSSNEVIYKYKAAAEIINSNLALKFVVLECKPDAKIVEMCEKGDNFITEQCLQFCVLLMAVVAHTHVINDGPVIGSAADVLAAANTSAEVALRLVRPGKKNKDVVDAIQKVAAAYDCKTVEGILSHQLNQFVIDGNKVVFSVSNVDTTVIDAEFVENEVYVIDIVTSTSEGKVIMIIDVIGFMIFSFLFVELCNSEPKSLSEKYTTIYKRAVDKDYQLKMKSSNYIFSEIREKFTFMPFTLRALEDRKRQFLSLTECCIDELLQPYPVLYEKQGDLVAHIKFTVLLMANGSDKITSHQL
ncbi:hypothetical protein VPH35_068718 [Triticum aestivum]